MKLWQVLAGVIIFKGADFAFVGAFVLPPDYKFPPIYYLGGWLIGSIVVWLLAGFLGGAWGHPKTADWGEAVGQTAPTTRPPPPPMKDD